SPGPGRLSARCHPGSSYSQRYLRQLADILLHNWQQTALPHRPGASRRCVQAACEYPHDREASEYAVDLRYSPGRGSWHTDGRMQDAHGQAVQYSPEFARGKKLLLLSLRRELTSVGHCALLTVTLCNLLKCNFHNILFRRKVLDYGIDTRFTIPMDKNFAVIYNYSLIDPGPDDPASQPHRYLL
uniref:2OG-FeII_Oxy_4 domain-containing protein n=1 Tax=Macrostomum lignano TaxID=282301 RepID=A0A1I8GH39_9PLAT